VASQGCDANGQWRTERHCPYGDGKGDGAMCTNDYCAPPATLMPTDCGTAGPTEQQCEQLVAGSQGHHFSCQPFIADAKSPATVAWWCAVPATLGTGVAGTACTLNSQCHTGFCGSNGTCFWACRNATECRLGTLQCSEVTIHVEGQSITTRSCIPH
jgi:hypothetical protein